MIAPTPPKADEFEISVMGPGRGECVIMHLGDNDWCVVDSCSWRGSSESAALGYLESLGTGALERVRLIVATHWHDDHVRGLASIVSRVPAASFACSVALQEENFFKLVGVAEEGLLTQSGVDEFAEILRLIERSRASGGGPRATSPMWAIENRRLLSLESGRRFPVSITALSPSDPTLVLAHQEIAKALGLIVKGQIRVPTITPNHASVVLWVEIGAFKALLGADLVHTTHPGEGWTAVLGCGDFSRAAFFKVPHHGSEGADCPAVWERMLAADPIAVVTPFNSVPLPKLRDLQRLAERTTRLYCTAKSTSKVPRRDPLVDKMMRRQVSGRRVIDGLPGHVRVRWSLSNPDADPTVELMEPAYHVIPADLVA